MMDLTSHINIEVGARYAYYFHEHILPTPKTEEAYAYFGIEPSALVFLTLSGEETVRSTTNDKLIITSMTFLRLSVMAS